MSVREDREKSNCPGRGLGLAAAAIGVGVGAALYYFFNKREENNPDTEGSTQNWQCDETLFRDMAYSASEDSYTTVSEHSTSDTSIVSSENDVQMIEDFFSNTVNASHITINDSDTHITINDSDESVISFNSNASSDEDLTYETGYITSPHPVQSSFSDSDLSINLGFDVTNSSLDVPHDQRELMSPSLFFTTSTSLSRRKKPTILQQHKDARRMQAFRERSWSLEECSICFDVILKDQEVMSLPCTHLFHSKCIMPWLEQQQTCPNCRKTVD